MVARSQQNDQQVLQPLQIFQRGRLTAIIFTRRARTKKAEVVLLLIGVRVLGYLLTPSSQ
jgi:hypothetical protein